MENSTKKKVLRLSFKLSTIFLIMFVFRLVYGYTTTTDRIETAGQIFDSLEISNRNFATKSYKQKTEGGSVSNQVDQKYEKIASINGKTAKFVSDDRQAIKLIKRNDALIQFEQRSGNDGDRKLSLVIGVPPENFDSLYQQLITIGEVTSKQITKKDKTNEYKELNAKKASLEKTLASLVELKSKGGKIEEFMNLENEILNTERQLQGLGVSLGDFDDENEFCTVKFSLLEGKVVSVSLIHRIKVAFQWTVEMFSLMMFGFGATLLVAYFIIKILAQSQAIRDLIGNKSTKEN